MDKDLKPCPQCNTTDHPKSTNKGHLCRPCASNRAKQWYKNNTERYFFNQIKAKYGLSKKEYESLAEAQNNKCAICFEEESALNVWDREKTRKLAVDHDHSTGIVRGLLCYRCNTTLGKVNDNIEILENMIKYLEETSGR